MTQTMTTLYRPATGEPDGTVPVTSPEELDEIFANARRGFAAWQQISGTDKGKLLFKLANRLEELVEEFAQIEARNTGKAIRETRAEAGRMPGTVRYWAGWADKLHGTTIPVGPDFHTYTTREPYGIVELTPNYVRLDGETPVDPMNPASARKSTPSCSRFANATHSRLRCRNRRWYASPPKAPSF